MLSIAISDLDLMLLIGGGFGAVCAVMGVIAYASMQTMKSVKADSKWKELAFWGSKRDPGPVESSPATLQSVMSRFSLQAPPTYSQFQLTGAQVSPLPPIPLGAQAPRVAVRSNPKQELIPWWDSSSPADTLYNDSSDASVSDSPLDTSVAPPPFGDESASKQTKMPKLPRQEYRIVIGSGLKSATKARPTRQRRRSAQQPQLQQQQQQQPEEVKREQVGQIKEMRQAERIQEQKEAATNISLPAPPPPIQEAITPPLALSTPLEEMETPVISKRNVRSLIKKSRSGFD